MTAQIQQLRQHEQQHEQQQRQQQPKQPQLTALALPQPASVPKVSPRPRPQTPVASAGE
jgi:hypothetical protein